MPPTRARQGLPRRPAQREGERPQRQDDGRLMRSWREQPRGGQRGVLRCLPQLRQTLSKDSESRERQAPASCVPQRDLVSIGYADDVHCGCLPRKCVPRELNLGEAGICAPGSAAPDLLQQPERRVADATVERMAPPPPKGGVGGGVGGGGGGVWGRRKEAVQRPRLHPCRAID